ADAQRHLKARALFGDAVHDRSRLSTRDTLRDPLRGLEHGYNLAFQIAGNILVDNHVMIGIREDECGAIGSDGLHQRRLYWLARLFSVFALSVKTIGGTSLDGILSGIAPGHFVVERAGNLALGAMGNDDFIRGALG